MDLVTLMHTNLHSTQGLSTDSCFISRGDYTHFYQISHSELVDIEKSDTQVITMKMEILPESTSNKLMVEHAEFDESNTNVLERFYTSAGNPVKEILLKLNLPDQGLLKDGGEVNEFQRSFRHSDTKRLSRSDEVLKLKNFKKDATLKLFKSTNQERYEHVGPEVTSSQDGIVYKKAKSDYAWLMVSRCSRSHIHLQIKQKEQAQA
ncbi:hypothetical protein Tco_1326530 [Tanacetum coccineum]